MKTKFFKFVIPAFAIVLAVAVSAFTTGEKPSVNKDGLIYGYVYESESNPCNKELVNCTIEGDQTCIVRNMTVFKDKNETSCTNVLKRN